MSVLRVPGFITAQSPIHHGGDEKAGNQSLIRRQTYIVDQAPIEIPVISGNAIRGILRRMIWDDLLTRVGYTLTNMKIYHMLFTGGILEAVDSKDSGVIDIDMKKKLREELPPLAVLGTALGNQMFEGKLKCAIAQPICSELKDFLPDDLPVKPDVSIYELVSFDFMTRLDDIKEARKEGEQAHQMLMSFEVINPGTVFVHAFALDNPNEVEKAVLARALNLWREHHLVGGKSGVGYGTVKLNYELDDDSAYLKFIEDNKDQICETLKWLELK
ncbi:MAG: RAMP superfamily CRISPR-associated protein [Clostridia bacterium]|nr:RAMP superfamily CRISPR-associated protein [Clostridia bacterium]